MLPTEAQDLLLGNFQNVKQEVPFSPTVYKGSKPEMSKLSMDCKKTQNSRETADCLFRFLLCLINKCVKTIQLL